MYRIIFLVLSLSLWASVSFAALNNTQISPIEKNIKIYHTNNQGIPTFVSGELRDKVVKGAELEAVHTYFELNKDIYRIQSPTDELHLQKVELDNLGMTHLRLQQKYNGLDVIGSDLTAHFRNDGMFTTVNGRYTPIKEMNTIAKILSSDALARAQDDLLIDFGEGIPTEPKLVVFPWQKEIYLCWRFFILSDTPMGRWEYFIDAETGDIIFKANRIMDAEAIGSGTGIMGYTYNHIDTWDTGSEFEMTDYTRRANNNIHGHDGQMASNAVIRTYLATSSLPGSVATDDDNVWGGTTYSPAVDGHMYTTLFYDWVLREYGRNSYDNNGSSMYTSVNYSAEGDNNAYWNGSQIVIWSWSTGWRSLASCPDVIAHEWGHAITGSSSGLAYQFESGAINESFSDMIGAAFEFAHDSLDTPDWYMGENATITGTGFRDMEDPHSKGDPDYYGTSDPYWIDVVGCTPTSGNDWCGVHTNCGVGNKWFSLLSDGGVHSGVTVNGLSSDTAMLIAFRANTVYWNTTTNYEEAAAGAISAAHDLDPSGNWEFEVAQAWTAVGVSTPTPSLVFTYPNGTPITMTPNVPETFDITVSGIFGGVAVPNSGQIYVSINGAAYQSSAMTEVSTNNYQATLPGRPCGDIVDYYISVDLVDPAVTVFDGSPSVPFTAVPFTGTLTVFQDDFESDLGWSISGGDWARGIPSGSGGEYGGADPTSGTVGARVMGYNLGGDYANSIPEYHVTSPVLDCSAISTAIIKFDRWLGVEQPAYDHAYIRVSTDNSNWTTVWENDIEIADNVWTAIEVDMSSVAALQSTVYVRFTMGTTDGGWRFCGWNIDNLRITGAECVASSSITITTTTLPNWTANLPYSEQLTAIDGVGTLNWSDKNNDLVSTGLTLSSSGLLSGTVTSGQVVSFTAMVTDDSSSDEQLLSFTVNSAIAIGSTSVPDWTEGVAMSHQFSASGGTGELVYTDKDDDLTASGLSLSPTGLLSGTPTAGSYNFTLLVTDILGANSETSIPITINSEVLISTTTLPDAGVGEPYSEQISASGGTGTLTFTDKNNDLASTGLALSATGLLSGTVISPQIISFTVLVTDPVGGSAEQLLSFNISQAITITPPSFPNWTAGVLFSEQIVASGGTGTLTFTDKNNDLASSGLTLSASGLLSGLPLSGTYNFDCVVTDSLGAFNEEPMSLLVNDSLLVVTTSLSDWTEGVVYSQQLIRSGGTGVVTFIDKNNDLSGSGLSISATGLLNGTSALTGFYTFILQISDVVGAVDEQEISININAPIAIITTTLPDGDSETNYAQQLSSSGGTGLASWTDKNNELAAYGLSLQADGLITGIPLSIGSVTFTAVAVDEVGSSDEQVYTFEIIMGYVCGDVDANGAIDISDLVFMVSFMFDGGTPPTALASMDVDGSGEIDIADMVYLVNYMFGNPNGDAPICGVAIQ